jgi:nucleotide-binding universal stress UspA family protein
VQAARALKAALPLLQRAAEVHVASWSARTPTAPFSGLDVGRWLGRHGVDARSSAHPVVSRVDDALRGEVDRLGCDLVVMGCYGHSRIRQQMFGGVTRGLLAKPPAPVLMAH